MTVSGIPAGWRHPRSRIAAPPRIPRAGPTDPLRPRAEGTGVPAGGLSEELFVVDCHKKKGLVTVAIHVVGCEIR